MKTILTLTMTGLITLTAHAEEKKLVQTNISAVRAAGSDTRSSGKPLTQTDMSRVLSTGSGSGIGLQFHLEDGHYLLGVDGSSDDTQSLFVSKSVNDSDKYIALLINNDAFKDDVGRARLMVGEVVNNGYEIQFSPTYIDINGNLVVSSAGSRNAKVLRISLKQDARDSRYPYMVRGLNGATNGVLLGMRGAKSNITLKPHPTANVFTWGNQNEKIVVNGNLMSRHIPGYSDMSYELINLNGDLGSFSGLVKTTEDTMTTDSASDVKYSSLVVFFSEGRDEDCMMIAHPTVSSEEMTVKLFNPRKKSFLEKIFSGRLTPKVTKFNPF